MQNLHAPFSGTARTEVVPGAELQRHDVARHVGRGGRRARGAALAALVVNGVVVRGVELGGGRGNGPAVTRVTVPAVRKATTTRTPTRYQ